MEPCKFLSHLSSNIYVMEKLFGNAHTDVNLNLLLNRVRYISPAPEGALDKQRVCLDP